MRSFILTLIWLLSLNTYVLAQSHQLSDNIDLPEVGWNKVLQTSNGNTMLFHIESGKAMTVKVFNTDRKEIASEKFLGSRLDLSMMENSSIHGIYEIGGEAVVFVSQAIVNNVTLVALRFNTTNGKIIKEQQLIESPTYKRRNTYSLVRNTVKGGYAVFCMKDLEANFKEELRLKVFDEKHAQIKDVLLDIKNDEYDYVRHLNTLVGNDGATVIVMNCKKIINYPDVMEQHLLLCYLPADSSSFQQVSTKLSSDIGPYYSMYCYNKFSDELNLTLVNAQTGYEKFGLRTLEKIYYSPIMLRYKANNIIDMTPSPIFHKAAIKHYKEHAGLTQNIVPIPQKIYVNKFGLSTLISEENEQVNDEPDRYSAYSTYLGMITVTQINETGDELWATVLPKRQIVANRLTAYEQNSCGSLNALFRRANPKQDWYNQFASFNSVMTAKGTCYVMYNDMKSNIGLPLNAKRDSLYNYEKSQMVTYKITKKREVSLEQTFDIPQDTLSTYAQLIQSGDYNEQASTYACLLLFNNKNQISLKLGWKKLED